MAGLDGGAGFGQRLAAGDLDGDGVVYVLFHAADATEGTWIDAERVALTRRGTTPDGRFAAGLTLRMSRTPLVT
ncbi:MAG: hypothetical protein EXR71_12300 [Myxococcales bacterium]|nr:hypothetical protein [Myxococcales bacterium]